MPNSNGPSNIYIISLSDISVKQLEKIMPCLLNYRSPDAYISDLVNNCISAAFHHLLRQGVIDTFNVPKEYLERSNEDA